MSQTQEKPALIDVDEVMRSRKSALLQFFRPLIKGYIRKIVHQDELNGFLREHHNDDILNFLEEGLFDFLGLTQKVYHEENIYPEPGKRYIYVANHPTGGPDGPLILYLLLQHAGTAKIMANDVLLNMKPMREVLVGVDLYGKKSRDSVRKIDEMFQSDAQVLIFPAGLISRRHKGVVKDTEWKPFFIKQAIRHKRDIIPVHLSGEVSDFFYNFANIRKGIGIRPNLELFYLPHEMFKRRNSHYDISFGKPIPHTYLKGQKQHAAQLANQIRDFIYELGAGKKLSFLDG